MQHFVERNHVMKTDAPQTIHDLKMKKKAKEEENIWLFLSKPILILIAIFVLLNLINDVGI